MIMTQTANNPVVLIEPLCINAEVGFAQSHGHELMYCTADTASIGMIVTNDTQFAHAAINPNNEPCEY